MTGSHRAVHNSTGQLCEIIWLLESLSQANHFVDPRVKEWSRGLIIEYVFLFITDCPSGTHWDNINGCATCPIGTNMEHPNRENNCIVCPEMTTTSGEGSVSEQDCVGEYIQYIPRNMHSVFALLCFVVVIH